MPALFYYLDNDSRTIGPVSGDEMRGLFKQGTLTSETLVAPAGGAEWFPFREIILMDEGPLHPAAPAVQSVAAAVQRTEPAMQRDAPQVSRQPSPAARHVASHPPVQRRPQAARPRPVPGAPGRAAARHTMWKPVRGMGRLAYFLINFGANALSFAIIAIMGGATLLTALKLRRAGVVSVDEFVPMVQGFLLVLLIAGLVQFGTALVTSVSRSRNIGVSGWMPVLFFGVLALSWLALSVIGAPTGAMICILLMLLGGVVLQTLPPGFASSLRLDIAAKVIMALYLGTFALVALVTVFGKESGGANVSWDLRKTHVTQLTVSGPSPQTANEGVPPAGVQAVNFPSGSLTLKAWLAKPLAAAGNTPALIYYHGGFGFGAEDFEVVRPFLEAGFAVMTPMLRGENGNPGAHELFYGELDDAAAAIRWLKKQEGIDPARIVTYGHSAGGVLSALLSLDRGHGVLLSASAGGLYDQSLFDHHENSPFDTTNTTERLLRAPAHHAGLIQARHLAYIGSDDLLVKRGEAIARPLATKTGAPLEIVNMPGDHFEMLGPATKLFLIEAKRTAGL